MGTDLGLACDGCGQAASPEHVARRLQLLEWATRYRPVHIATLLLGAVAPSATQEFFYSPEGPMAGEGARLAEIAGLSDLAGPKDQLHAAFQRAGFFATHVLECPSEATAREAVAELIKKRLPAAITRIRRSLRPKKIAVISRELEPFAGQLRSGLPDSRLILNGEKAFRLEPGGPPGEILLLQQALAAGALRQA
jgi:hypothetical protein